MEEKEVTIEIGTTGLNQWSGQITEEFLKELRGSRGRRTYDEMRRNDPVIGAFLFAIEMALRQMDWRVEVGGPSPADQEARGFLDSCLGDMSHTWNDFISECLTMVAFGWSIFELCYKRRQGFENFPLSKHEDGRIGWRKFAFRSQDTLDQWKFDEAGGVLAFVQTAPPDYQSREIPIEKLLLFRAKHERNNPEGYSVLRNCYRPWYFKSRLESLEGIVLERRGAGLPVMRLPQGASTTDRDAAKDIVRKIRIDEQMGVTLPFGWNLELLSPGARAEVTEFGQAIVRYRQEMLMSVLATFIALGTEKVGSYALSKDAHDFFLMSLTGWADAIEEVLNTYAVPRLFSLNSFPDASLPQIRHSDLSAIDLKDLGYFLTPLAQIGAIEIDENLENHLRRLAKLPPKPLKEGAPLEKKEAGEGWHPRLKGEKTLVEAESRVEGVIRMALRQQSQWLKANWERLLPITKQISEAEWDEWDTMLAKELAKSLAGPIAAGAEAARKDLPGIIVDWHLGNPKAQEWLGKYSLNLAKGLNETTRDEIRQALKTGLSLGETRDELAKRVGAVAEDMVTWRAKMIAQTETINAYTQGSLQLYRESGVVKKKTWLDGQPLACEFCQDLDGTSVDLDSEFESPLGNVQGPALHPGCRCAIAGET